MTKEEMKNKYSAFITEISETLGLGKPIDILKLCATTDLFFQPLENRITELEKACDETQELLDKQIEATYKLDKENAELKADNDARKFAMVMSEKVEKQLREENTKLKDVIEGYKKIAKWCDKCDKIAELEAENQKWKDEWQEQVQKATDEGYARTLQTIQLTKAKVFIRGLKSLIEDVCDINYLSKDNTRLLVEAEQFLNSEVEK